MEVITKDIAPLVMQDIFIKYFRCNVLVDASHYHSGEGIGMDMSKAKAVFDSVNKNLNEHINQWVGITYDYPNGLEYRDVFGRNCKTYTDFVNPAHCKLILTSVSDITDERAIEVAKILSVSYSNSPVSNAHFDITGLSYYLKELFERGSDITERSGFQILQLVDYLRSKGYMLPAFGYDLYEAGIAIKPSEINL